MSRRADATPAEEAVSTVHPLRRPPGGQRVAPRAPPPASSLIAGGEDGASDGPGIHSQTEIEAWAALGSCPPGVFCVDSGGGPGSGCVDSDADGIQDDTANSADNYCENLQLRDTLALGRDTRVHYVFSSGAQHSEPAWKGRSAAIFRLFEDG